MYDMETKRLNILVTGGNGQLGMCLRDESRRSPHRFIFSDVNDIPGLETLCLDITDRKALDLVADSENIDIIVNCAGYTNVEKAEDEISLAELLNATAVGNLADTMARRDGSLIHISTDFVFDGSASSPIPECAEPAPLSVYGATKLAGEKAAGGCRSIILRTAWLYSEYGRNFVKTMLSLTAEKPVIKVVADQIGTPTYARGLAALIVHIIDSGQIGKSGIYHYTDEGAASWYDLASAVNRLAGHDCKVLPCRSEDYPAKARRPHYSVLDKSLVKQTFGVSIPWWQDSLRECMDKLSK